MHDFITNVATAPFPQNIMIIGFYMLIFSGPLGMLALIIFLIVKVIKSSLEDDRINRYKAAYKKRLGHEPPPREKLRENRNIYPDGTMPNWTPEAVKTVFEQNEKRSYERYTEELRRKQEQEELRNREEENFMNGKINWRPLGKKYTPNPRALERLWGMEDVIEEIEKSIKNLLMNPKLVAEYNVSMNAGLLLYGPPGTGKTELARAVAEHLGVYFMALKSSDLVSTLVGGTEQNITEMFKEARQHAPSILFIDEIDAIGTQRGSSHQYHDGPLTQLLMEMDGFEKRDGVFVLAATNRIDALDDALLRDGRFGTRIEVPAPDPKALWNMFTYWASPLHLDKDVYAVEIGMALQGHTGATVKGLVERLKHIEIDKRVHGKKAIITREEVFGEIEKIMRKKRN